MVERVRNVIKRDKKRGKGPQEDPEDHVRPKRRRSEAGILRRYPVSSNLKAICNELSKAKPRDSVLLPLMKSTYGERRIFIVNMDNSVNRTLEKFSALRRPAVVSFFM